MLLALLTRISFATPGKEPNRSLLAHGPNRTSEMLPLASPLTIYRELPIPTPDTFMKHMAIASPRFEYLNLQRETEVHASLALSTIVQSVTTKDEASCGICYEAYSVDRAPAILPRCHHVICLPCLVETLLSATENHDRCPMCRQRLREDTPVNEGASRNSGSEARSRVIIRFLD